MRKLIFLFVIAALGFNSSISAQQLKSFTHDNEKYVQELQDFFAQGNPKAAKKFIQETFLPVWNSGHYSTAQKDRIYELSDLMLKKRKKAIDFENYIYTLISFAESSRSAMDFAAFQDGMEQTVAKLSRRQFTEYLEVCKALFSDYVLYESASVKWVAKTDNYQIVFDSLPKIVFGQLDLKAFSKRDSSIIYGTQGVYYPTLKKWIGKGGKVDWVRAGFDAAETYAVFDRYTIDATKSSYVIDSVTFHHPVYLEKPYLGVLTEKILADVTAEKASYPRFDSYDKRIDILGMYEDVDFSGGFSQHGIRFIGSGDDNQAAELIFRKMNHITKKTEPFLTARSKSFVIMPDKVLSRKTALVLSYEGDSIFHPEVQMNYNVENHVVTFSKAKEGSGRSPFYDTYHKMDLHVDKISWNLKEDWVELENVTAGEGTSAIFESDTYYDEYRYDRLQGGADFHPLWRIRDYARSVSSDELSVEEVARIFRADISDTKIFLINLSNSGFMTYDFDKGKVVIKPRLHHYVLSKSKKTDYDALRLESVIQGVPNAKLNLLNWDLDLKGVGRVFLSDSQNVVVFPNNQELVLKKNRDFQFNGRIAAGRLTFYGEEFYFNYDDFKIDLGKVDSLRLTVPDGMPDENQRQRLRAVKTVLRDLQGELLVDRPDNKSGVVNHSRYPVFNSRTDSYVYFDKKSIQNGVYNKERFYMHLEPFSIDSVENFSKEGLEFAGEFVSDGIFPDFNETLRLQPDFSLGFVRDAPPEGFASYGDKGKYTASIRLSEEGLRGDGQLEYLTSVSKSKDFLFYPDSINGIAETFTVTKQRGSVQYPPVNATAVSIHWEPKNDHFYAYSVESPFNIYEGEVAHQGGLDLHPKGLNGYGSLDFANAVLKSEDFGFDYQHFGADTGSFRLRGATDDAFAFKTNNVKMSVDLSERLGRFKSNTGGDFVDFPVNQYICYIDEFKWNIDQKNIDIVSDQGEGSRYVSTHPKQDSLDFRSPSALFDLQDFVIRAKEVSHIEVADATILPHQGNVIVRENAKMDSLLNAKVIANRTTQFHSFYESSLNVLGKKQYSGTGKYDYEDVTGGKQSIQFSSIGVDTAGQTVAEGVIQEEMAFTLSPNFDYKGKAKLRASEQFLSYSGSTRIKHDCPGITRDWLAFDASVDPSSIYIPIPKNPKDASGSPMSSGVVISKDSTKVYPTFLSNKLIADDIDVVAAEGYLHFDNASQEYRIASRERLEGAVVAGNYLSLNNECIALGEGRLNLGLDLGQVELTPIGTVKHNMNNDSTKVKLFLGVDFFFNQESIRIMAGKINLNFPPLDPVVYDSVYEKVLIELVGKDKTAQLMEEINLNGAFKKMPKELEQTLFLTNVNLVWDAENGAYQHKGMLGISSVGGYAINKMVYGLIKLEKRRSGDILSVYLEPGENNWFYFTYKRGLLGAFSSSNDFNSYIRDTKDDKRTKKGEKGKPNLTYVLSTAIQRRNFVRSFEE
ncbi:hypothetical protein ACFLR1_00115 [Bacteroidota bacterium]